jgi:hypothetical protein
MLQAIGATRPGGHVGFVGVAHGVELPVEGLFWSLVHLHGGPAPVRRFLPQLIDLIWNRQIDPGKVFDLTLPLEQAAEGYQAMDQRRAITKEKAGCWTRRRAFAQVRQGSNIQLLPYPLVRPCCAYKLLAKPNGHNVHR